MSWRPTWARYGCSGAAAHTVLWGCFTSRLGCCAEQVTQLCGRAVEAGLAYNTANQMLLGSLTKLALDQEQHGGITVGSTGPCCYPC